MWLEAGGMAVIASIPRSQRSDDMPRIVRKRAGDALHICRALRRLSAELGDDDAAG